MEESRLERLRIQQEAEGKIFGYRLNLGRRIFGIEDLAV